MRLIEFCRLNNIPFIGNSSIKSRIWFGFGLILFVLIFVALSTLSRFVHLSSGISEVTEEIQPVVLTAQNLETKLETASNALGFYLLTKNDEYKNAYFENLDKTASLAAQLAEFEFVANNSIYSSTVGTVTADLQKLAIYKNRMVELVGSDTANIPALKISVDRSNPLAQQIQAMISQMIRSDYDEENSNGNRNEYRKAMYDLRYYNSQLLGELRTFLAFRSQVNVENMKSVRDVMASKFKIVKDNSSIYTFEQEEVIGKLLQAFDEFVKGLDEIVQVHGSDKYRTDVYLVKTEIGSLVRKIETDLGSLVDELKQIINTTSTELQDEANGASSKVIAGMSIGIIVGIVVAFFMARMITAPINAAVHAMEDLAQGEGDLTRRLDEKGESEIAQMARGFNGFAGKVQSLVSEVARSVQNLSMVVNEVSGIVDQTQHGSQSQRQQTEQVATAVTEMTASVQEVASNANLAADSAQQADDNAQSGRAVVKETISSINSLASEIETGANVISKLSQDAESIGTVLDVIKGIAEQTNLLALNAAIEAARAGEQGRGFAVVADEVRMLASRTQTSTKEIEGMIDSLQDQARAAVAAITQGQDKARDSVNNASNAGKALEEITNSVAMITSMNIQIATASEEQSSVAEEINQNVVNISHVADENAQASNRLAMSSDELAKLAGELQNLVSQFKY